MRIQLYALASILFVMALTLVGCDKHAGAKRDILDAWKMYDEAAGNNKGDVAAGWLCKSTLDSYTELAKLALDIPAAKLAEKTPTQALSILCMRAQYSRKELKGISGKDVVARMIDDNMWGDFDGWELRNIRVDAQGTSATTELFNPEMEKQYSRDKMFQDAIGGLRASSRKGAKPPTYPLRFVLESGRWRIDEAPITAVQDVELIAASRANRMSVRDFLTAYAGELSDKELPLSIWDPLPK